MRVGWNSWRFSANNARFPSFRCCSSVAVSPFCRCVILLVCKNYVTKFRSVTAVKSKKDTQRQRQRCTETAAANGNGETATEWWKPGISRRISEMALDCVALQIIHVCMLVHRES